MECGLAKKYEKVDSFLKRFLAHSRYTGVRLIEPCIAVSSVYNKQFKFVVLADEWLYVTENPPKVAKDIQEVTRIVDIISVELINDVPEFLGGDLKYRTHHILVTYKKTSESDISSKLAPVSSASNLLTKSLQEKDLRRQSKSNLSGEDGSPTKEVLRARRQKLRSSNDNLSRSLQENDLTKSRQKSRTSILDEDDYVSNGIPHAQSALANSKHANNFSRSLQEIDLKNFRKNSSSNYLDEDHSLRQDVVGVTSRKSKNHSSPRQSRSKNSFDEDEKDSSPTNSKTLQVQQDRRQGIQNSWRKSTRAKGEESLDQNVDFPRKSKEVRTARSGDASRNSRTPRRDSGTISNENEQFSRTTNSKTTPIPLFKFSSFDSEDENCETNPLPLHHSFSTVDDFRFKNSANATRLTASAGAADLRAAFVELNPKLSNLNSGSEPNLTSAPKGGLMGSFNGLQSWFKERHVSKSGGKTTGNKSAGPSSEDLVDGSSPSGEASEAGEIHLYMILDDTVMLAYLHSVWDNCLLNTALKYNKIGKSSKAVAKNKPNSSQVTALFNQLEKEILNSEDFRATFELVHELLTASQKDVLVKKLFWQSPDLFVFLVRKINQYIKERPDECTRGNRADEMEFILLLFECLTEMFRETELLSSRMTRLKSKKYSVVHDLIVASVTSPKLGNSPSVVETPDISEAAEVLLSGKRPRRKVKKNKTPDNIELEKLSRELIKQQVALLHEIFIIAYQAVWFPSDDKTLNLSWVVRIIESSKTVQTFLQAFVQEVMDVTTKAEGNCLTADDTILLFRILSVLKTFLQQSSKLRQHIHDYYTEEFRYYIKPHTISNSLSQDCPLTSSTLKLIGDVVLLVTDVPLSDRRPPR